MSQAVGPEWKQADAHLAMLARADKTVEMARGLDRCVKILTPQVQMRTPVGATGRLRGSIKGETRVTARGALQGVVWTNVFYAHFVEQGTYSARAGGGRRMRPSRRASRGTRPHWMFRNAWESNRRRCEQILGDVYGKLVSHWRGGRVGK